MIVLAQKTVLWTGLTVLLSWLLPRRLQMPAVILSTCLFLAVLDRVALALLACQVPLVLWALPRVRRRGVLTAALVALLVLVLAAFKLAGERAYPARVAMPLGISYMAFRLIHLLVDGYAGRLPVYSTEGVLAYLLFLPPLPVGPIHRLPEFLVDLRRRRFDAGLLGRGLERVLHGYAKLVILRNLILLPYLLPALSRSEGASFLGDTLAASGRWLDLYVSFSGASDLAIGYALAMGFRIQENFRFPFLAASIPDFWRRWHISLTLWCRDYVYAPVAAATRRPVLAVAVAMVVIGLWHEASLRYILWGLYHAAGILATHRLAAATRGWWTPGGRRAWLLRPLGTLATLVFVVSSFPVTARLDGALKSHLPWRNQAHVRLPLPAPAPAPGQPAGGAVVYLADNGNSHLLSTECRRVLVP
jgi:alginate O-acetyltransferase complex protein AlgI